MQKFVVIYIFITLVAGCDRRTPSTMATAVANAVKSEPNVAAFERLYPGSVHSISYYNTANGQPRWNSNTLIHGRYELTMQFDIDIDRKGTTVTTIQPPQFWLNERRQVKRQPNGTLSISYEPDGRAEFGVTEWKKLVSAGGDISVLSIGNVDNTPLDEISDTDTKAEDSAPPVD